MLESAYETCFAYELNKLGIGIERQVALPIVYKEIKLDCAYRIDILIEKQLILEIKAVEIINEVHTAQILTYMKFAKMSTGLLINFNVTKLKDGIKRFVL